MVICPGVFYSEVKLAARHTVLCGHQPAWVISNLEYSYRVRQNFSRSYGVPAVTGRRASEDRGGRGPDSVCELEVQDFITALPACR